MSISNSRQIPEATIVLTINKKTTFFHHFAQETPLDQQLLRAFNYKKDRAEAFVLLAEYAVKTYHPFPISSRHPIPTTHLEAEWEQWFGPRKLAPMTGTRDNIRGTIFFPTPKETFKYEMTGRELFIPELEKSFWRQENSAEALSFLARFAARTYDHSEIFEANLVLGWNGNFGNPH